MEVRKGKYKHYKGKFYRVIGVARHSETLKELVVYQGLYDNKESDKNSIWVRPKSMFLENVIINGKEVPRFEFIEYVKLTNQIVDKLFVATKAFIVHNGKILLLKESSKYSDGSHTGKFDVVGGRVEPGQRFDQSLLREIKEETGLDVTIGRPFFVNEWRTNVRGEEWQIVGTFFECSSDLDKVTLSEDHEEYVWINPEDYKDYNIIENLIPVFESFLNK